MTKIKTIIFDFDGTLADTLGEIIRVNNELHKSLGTRLIPEDKFEELRNLEVRKWFRQIFGIPLYKIPFWVARFKKKLYKDMTRIKTFKDIPKTIKTLKDRGINLGVLTTDADENAREFLAMQNMNCFDFIIEANFIFGKAHALRKIMRSKKLAYENTLYVGDTVEDIRNSKKVGIKIAAVTWGFSSHELLAKYCPDFLIDTPQELLEITKRAAGSLELET